MASPPIRARSHAPAPVPSPRIAAVRGSTSSFEYVSARRSENSVITSYGVARPPYTTRSAMRRETRRTGQSAAPIARPASRVSPGRSVIGPTTIPPISTSAVSDSAANAMTTIAATSAFFTTMSRSHRRYLSKARPIAMGIPIPSREKNTKNAISFTSRVSSPSRPMPVRIATTSVTPAATVTYASQRSCWRSSPPLGGTGRTERS
jgi:hypothetical protein